MGRGQKKPWGKGMLIIPTLDLGHSNFGIKVVRFATVGLLLRSLGCKRRSSLSGVKVESLGYPNKKVNLRSCDAIPMMPPLGVVPEALTPGPQK